MKGFAMSDFVCQSLAGLFSLWNAIAPWDTPLSLHHLGTSQEQRAASAEQTACRPRCLTTILPTALSAGCHDSMGKTPETKHRSSSKTPGHRKWGWEKSVCFTTKTVKLCHPTAAAAQLRVYFKFRLTSERADNPTVNTADSVDLVYAWPMTTRPLSQLSVSPSLSHDSYAPLYAQTQTDSWLDDFWLCRESASARTSSVVVWAQQVFATSLLLSSVLLVLECTVLQTQLKQKKRPMSIL